MTDLAKYNADLEMARKLLAVYKRYSGFVLREVMNKIVIDPEFIDLSADQKIIFAILAIGEVVK